MRPPFVYRATMEDGEIVTLLAHNTDQAIALFKERYTIGREIIAIERYKWEPPSLRS